MTGVLIRRGNLDTELRHVQWEDLMKRHRENACEEWRECGHKPRDIWRHQKLTEARKSSFP